MTSSRSRPSAKPQPSWLRWLLLVCLLGLQLHAPSHALGHLAAALSEAAAPVLATDSHEAVGEAAVHGSSTVSDCCPAGLLAISHSLNAAALVPAEPLAVTTTALAYSPALVFSPYLSRAPPV